jgi:transcriptional regulator with XRE-family HTH domain
MVENEEQQRVLLHNLAMHSGPARARLRLSLSNAARLAGLAPEALSMIENGSGCTLSLAALTHLALSLGLTEEGEPRPLPSGME